MPVKFRFLRNKGTPNLAKVIQTFARLIFRDKRRFFTMTPQLFQILTDEISMPEFIKLVVESGSFNWLNNLKKMCILLRMEKKCNGSK